MSKVNAMAAILKFINGRNDNRQYLQEIFEYITDPAKTDNGKLIAAHGCSCNHPLSDIFRNKKLHNKTSGKQGEHFVLSFPSSGSEKSPADVLNIVSNIAATLYPENISVTAVHTDSRFVHAHVLLDAVNAVTGHKFSQSPSDLNRVKQKTNNILKKHDFEIITASANDFVDHTDYSKEESFNFLELDESMFITDYSLDEISKYTDSDSLYNTIDALNNWYGTGNDTKNKFGGYDTMNNNYLANVSQTQALPIVEDVSSVMPTVPQAQEFPAPTPTIGTVPTTVETSKKSYPNTTVLTGPTFRIRGNENSNFAGLDELVEQTTADAQEHQREAANLALAMQQYGQQTGYPSNVSIYAGPVFDIDLTGVYQPLPGYDENKL